MHKLRYILLSIAISCALFTHGQQLTDSQLLTEAARICISGSHEAEECEVLAEAARRFELPQLTALIEMRKGKEVDEKYKHLCDVTTALLEVATKRFGEGAVEVIKCRRAKLSAFSFTNYNTVQALSVQNLKDAKTLTESNPKDLKLKELYLLTQLEDLIIRLDREIDNPLIGEETYRIEQQCDTLYIQLTGDSEERKEIYSYLGNLKNMPTSYNEYLNQLFYHFYPNGSPAEAKIYSDLVWTSAEAYLRMTYEMCLRLYGDKHLTTLYARLDYLRFLLSRNQISAEEAHNELSMMLQRLKEYCPYADFLTIRAELLLWECDIMSNSRLYETDRYNTLLFNASIVLGSDSESYLNVLNSVLWQRQQVNIDQAQALSTQVEALTKQVFQEQPDIMWRYLLDLYVFKQGALSDEAFNDYIASLTGNYAAAHHPSWASVAYGRLLANVLRVNLFKYDNAAMTFELMMEDLGKLVGKQHEIYAIDLNTAVSYLTDARRYDDAERLCLQGINDKLLDGKLEPSFCSQLCNIYAIKNDPEKGKKYAEQGIEASHKLGNEEWECHMQLTLANILLNNKEEERAGTLFESAIPVFLQRPENVTDFVVDYFYINDYYQYIGQFDKALKVLEDGFERYGTFFNIYDNTYVRFIQEIYKLYAVQLDDYDHAEQFLEGHLQQLTTSPTSTSHDEKLQLLWMHYNMLLRKSPGNLLKRFALIQDIQKETMLICKRINSTSYFDLNTWLMPILNELVTIINEYMGQSHTETAQMEELIKTAKDDGYKQEMESYLEYAQKNMRQLEERFNNEMMPILKDFEEEIRTKRPDYLSLWDYFDVTQDIASIYFSVIKDSIEGGRWLRAMIDSPNKAIRGMTLYRMSDFELSQQQYAQAAQHLEAYRKIVEEIGPNVLSRSNEANLKGALFMAYYHSGHREKALPLARDIHQLRGQLIHENLDVMTESEREAFVSKDVGGSAIQLLLSFYPEELAGECYNSILEEKGLLLRAAASKRQAILQSGDTSLIVQLKQLDDLNAAYRQKNTMANWRAGENFVGRDITDLNGQIEQLERQINRDAVKYYTEPAAIPTWQQVQQMLKEGDAAIEFVNSENMTSALVLLPDGQAPHYVALTNSDSLYNEMEGMKLMRQHSRVERMYQEDSLMLYARLWQPLEPLLHGAQHIFYSPTGYLNSLAFAAFRHPSGDYLIDHYDLHQLTSTAELTIPRHERPQRIDALLLGAAYYSPEQEAVAQKVANDFACRGRDDDRGAVIDDEEYFGYLAYTAEEVNQVRDIMSSANLTTITLKGFDANEAKLVGTSGHSPYIMHLSTHGYFLSTNEEVMVNKFLARYPATRFSSMQRAGLALAGANATWTATDEKPEADDGILTAEEASRLDLRQTELAVLSACQTGVGFYNRDGVFGMHRGFKQAGVTTILATLWNVNDRSTALMMSAFYRQWLAGKPIQQALRDAIQELRKDYPSPFYWAPFVLLDAKE